MVPDRMDDSSMTAADMVPTAAGTRRRQIWCRPGWTRKVKANQIMRDMMPAQSTS